MARSKKEKEPKSDWVGVSDAVQKALLGKLSDEFAVAKRNNESEAKTLDRYYNMLRAIREAKPNDWEPDISLPEFASRILSQIGNFCTQYFSSADYVETSGDSDDPKDIAEAKASKKLLNSILNDPEAHYFHKLVRTMMFAFVQRSGIIKGEYRQKIEKKLSHYETVSDYSLDPVSGQPLAEDGMLYTDPTLQRPAFMNRENPVFVDDIVEDGPTFDVYPKEHVYMSPEYTYSLNDKEYIFFESEKTLDQLKRDAKMMGYFNLGLLEKRDPVGVRGEKTYNREKDTEEQPSPPVKTFVIRERWGLYPTVLRDEKYLPGYDEMGNLLADAENTECIIYFAQDRAQDLPEVIIGFRKSKHSKRPMARFLCYIDMFDDNGFSDGDLVCEIQKAGDDNYNLINKRTQLAITPAFKGKRFANVPEIVKVSPENVIMLENMDDLQEFKIEDNIQGGIVHQQMLASRMDYAMATSPQTMGMNPERAETATMASIVNQRSSVRMGMKSLTLEFVGFQEFYSMLLTLCNDFMLPETLEKLIGKELAMAYNPQRKDKFRPVSQALTTEESKQFNIKAWQGLYGMSAQVANPRTPMVLNYIMGQILELMGGRFKAFKKYMFDEDPVTQVLYQLATGSKGGGSAPAGPNPSPGMQNQQGQPQRPTEMMVRQNAPQQQM